MPEQTSLDTGSEDAIPWYVMGWDGTLVAVIPAVSHEQHPDPERDVDSWDAASKWAYLAARKYDSLMWSGRS